jgi:hypothetical protein
LKGGFNLSDDLAHPARVFSLAGNSRE